MPLRLSRREMLFGAAAVATAPAVARASTGADDFDLTETTLVIRGLDPAHDGLRVAQLSDFHVGQATPDGRLLAAIGKVNERKPDLVFLTGDFVTHSTRPLAHIPELLSGLDGPTFAVLGNHDHRVNAVRVAQDVRRMGYELLENQNTRIWLRGAPVWVLGIDDGVSRHDDVGRTLAGVPQAGTRLVLAHAPPTADKLTGQQNLAVFSGHTHGGQFVIPVLTDALFRGLGQPYVRGLYRVGSNQLYVNRGLGFGAGGALVRLGAEPEVSLFTLRAA